MGSVMHVKFRVPEIKMVENYSFEMGIRELVKVNLGVLDMK